MKHLLLPLLLLPVCSFAQSGHMPTMQQHMQSVRQFNQMTNQRTMDFQQRQMQRSMANMGGSRTTWMTRKDQQEALAKQLELEKEANEKLTKLAQELQRKREEHPTPNPQQAALQQKKDDKQLTLLTVKNYKEVFLPGQLNSALQSRQLSFEGQRQFLNLNKTLSDKKWWKQQQGAQLTGSLKAYSDTLTSLTTDLLGFNLASPPAMPATPSTSGVKAQLATFAFDQNAATQLMRDAALSEKLLAGMELMKAVQEFNTLNAAAASPELQSNPKKLQDEVEATLRHVDKAMSRYNARFIELTLVTDTYRDLLKYTSAYVAKNDK